MRKVALLIIVVTTLFVGGLYLFKAFATPRSWQLAPTASPYQTQPNSDKQPVNFDASGGWYCPMIPDYQPKYYWYNIAKQPGRIYSRDQLLNMVWGYDYCGDSRTVDTHVNRLRSKIESQAGNSDFIQTVRGVGYKFEISVL